MHRKDLRSCARVGRAAFVSGAMLCLPSLAWACAACMNDDPQWQRKVPILLGFIAFPFIVFAAVAVAIRRHVRPELRSHRE